MVLYIAGLQGISRDYYEAAEIDGANAWQRFKNITIPLLNPTIVVNVLMAITGGLVSNYDIVHIMTDGGPFHATEVSATYIMRTAFNYGNMGKANAMTMITFVSLVGITAIAGAIGAGGLGDFAIRYGYQMGYRDMIWLTVIIILLIISVFQFFGNIIIKKSTH